MTAVWRFEAIGTAWEIETTDPLDDTSRRTVLDVIDAIDRRWSRFRPDSLVSRAAETGGSWELCASDDRLLRFYDRLHAATDGALTPLVGRRLADLGYDADYTLRPSATPAAVPSWDVVRWDPPVLHLAEPVLVDVGAAGKGFVVDAVSRCLAETGHARHTVDGSGDLLHAGEWPLRVALQDPRDHTKAVGVVEVASGEALAASATDRRAWGDGLHHVLDGRTGEPTRDVMATWVVADDAMTADGLATALFFTRPENLARQWRFGWVIMKADGSVRWSRDLAVEVFGR